MRISDWSSDVCSSDLDERTKGKLGGAQQHDPMIIFADQRGRITEFANGFIHVPCSSQLVTSRPPSRVIYACARRRSEERRVGKECVRTGRSGWSPNH